MSPIKEKLIDVKQSATGSKKKRTKKVNSETQYFMEKDIPSYELSEAASKIKTLERTSTPNSFDCEHCDHDHERKCCLYVYDDESDIKNYADFKRSADEFYCTMETDEDFDMKIGSTTPFGFPAYTLARDQEKTEKKVENPAAAAAINPPVVYLRQYLYPIYMPQVFTPQPNYYHQPQPQYTKPIIYASTPAQYIQPAQQHQTYMPPIQTQQYCIMRQVPISIQYNANYATNVYSQVPQSSRIIESHHYNYLAVNYFGGQQ